MTHKKCLIDTHASKGGRVIVWSRAAIMSRNSFIPSACDGILRCFYCCVIKRASGILNSYRRRNFARSIDCHLTLPVLFIFPLGAQILSRKFLFISLHPNVDKMRRRIHTCCSAVDPTKRKVSRAHQQHSIEAVCATSDQMMRMCLQKQCSLLYMFFMYVSARKSSRICHISFWTRRRFGDLYVFALHMVLQWCFPNLIYFSSLVTIKLFIWYVYRRSECFEFCENPERKKLKSCARISFHIYWRWKPVVTYGL